MKKIYIVKDVYSLEEGHDGLIYPFFNQENAQKKFKQILSDFFPTIINSENEDWIFKGRDGFFCAENEDGFFEKLKIEEIAVKDNVETIKAVLVDDCFTHELKVEIFSKDKDVVEFVNNYAMNYIEANEAEITADKNDETLKYVKGKEYVRGQLIGKYSINSNNCYIDFTNQGYPIDVTVREEKII